MARGFESKQVEDQQAEAERRRALRERGQGPASAAGARQRSLALARADVLRRLAETRHERLRRQLEMSLAAIDEELASNPASGLDPLASK